MPALRDDIDPDGLLEYSVVFSDRSLNSMSDAFGEVMRDISRIMRNAYGAASVWLLFPEAEHMAWRRLLASSLMTHACW